jgi:hypothetical protein
MVRSHHVQHVAATDREARHRRSPASAGCDLPLQIQDVGVNAVVVDVAAATAHALVAARAEGDRTGAGEDHHPLADLSRAAPNASAARPASAAEALRTSGRRW